MNAGTTAVPRILHFIDTGGPGGAETVFLTLADATQRRSQNAAIAVPYDGWLAARLRERGITPVILPAKRGMSPALLESLVRTARSSGASLIHAHLLGAGVYAALAGLLLRLPVIVVFHGATDLRVPGSLAGVKQWLLTRRHVTLVAVSEAVREAMHEWGLPADRIQLVLNGVDTRAFTPGPGGRLQEELGLPTGTRIVGAVGNIRPAKSYETLVDAAARVIEREPEVHFAIAGSGPDESVDKLKTQVANLGIEGRFHLLGFRQSSADLYRSFSVFASSAGSEGLPLSFLEAMACGIPIAATANEGAGPLLRTTHSGLLSPVGDPAALATSILALLRDSSRAGEFGVNGRRSAVTDFSLQKTLDAYQSLYRLLTEAPT